MNVILIASPFLLIGLSIDYAVHVVMRYREARAGTLGASEVETGGVDSPDVVSSAGDGIQSEDRTIESSTGRQQSTRSSTARPR